jgi:hypothetical protein
VHRFLENSAIREKTGRVVWLTPGERSKQITESMLNDEMPMLAVYGSRDRYAENVPFERLKERANVAVMIVPDADHALETDDPVESILHLKRYVELLRNLYAGS